MNLRRLGGLLLLIVVLGALLVSRAGGARVAGSAVIVPAAAVPGVGDCLAGVVGSLEISTRGGFPPLPLPVVSVGETSVLFADCADEHVGEVVAFRPTPPTPSGGVPVGGSDTQWCNDTANGYRADAISRFRSASGGYWQPAANQRFVAILGGTTGYSWAACALLAPGLELYSGSDVESLTGRPAPAPFGTCRSGDNRDRSVSCTSSHRVQEFGVAVQAGLSPPSAIRDCTALVEAMTGLPDVNAGGLLAIQVAGGGAADGGGDYGRCRLITVGPNRLIGTLTGIGTGKLPLA